MPKKFTKFNAKIIRCGITNQTADIIAKDINTDNGLKFSIFPSTSRELRYRAGNFQFSIPIVGEFNIMNALLAIAPANFLGVSLPECAKALQKFKGPEGRMEEVYPVREPAITSENQKSLLFSNGVNNTLGFRIFVDYAPEPAGMEAALKAVSQMPHSRNYSRVRFHRRAQGCCQTF